MRAASQRRNAVVGLVAVALLAAAGWVMFLFLGGVFKPGFEVTAVFERAGQLLRSGSDVKLRGVLVGEVMRIDVDEPGDAQVVMRIFPDQVAGIPANVDAIVRAKTLFGEKFVELRIPERPSRERIAAGDVIPKSRTTPPIEVETILEKALPLLEAIEPDKFAAALRALTEGLTGNEEPLRRATLQGLRALEGTQRTLPNLERNIVHLRNFAEALDTTDEELLAALVGLEQVGSAVNRSSAQLPGALDALTRLTRDLGDISNRRLGDLRTLAEDGTPILEYLQSKAPDLPEIVSTLDGFLANWIVDLSSGPFWRIVVATSPSDAAPYAPGQQPGPAAAAQARTALLRQVAGLGPDDAATEPPGASDILLAPIPTEGLASLLDRISGTVTSP